MKVVVTQGKAKAELNWSIPEINLADLLAEALGVGAVEIHNVVVRATNYYWVMFSIGRSGYLYAEVEVDG